MAHDHDCFAAAAKSRDTMLARTKRVGFFIYVGEVERPSVDDIHYYGNTAFASAVFVALVDNVIDMHEPGECPHCDRVAVALKAARAAYNVVMSRTAETKPC